MHSVFATVRAGAGVFAGTNVEDLVVLTALFLSSRARGQPKVWQIWAGQYAGIGFLTALSVVGAVGLLVVPKYWVGLLGIVPLVAGVIRLWAAIRARGRFPAPRMMATGARSVAALAIANGGDNVSVYVPVFRTVGLWAMALMIAVFAAGVALWCVAATLLGSHPKIVGLAERYGHWIVPAVFIGVGVTIITSSGVIGHLS